MRSALLTSQWKKCGHFQSLKLYEDRLKLYDVVSGNIKEGLNNVLKKTQHPTMHIFVSITIQKTGALFASIDCTISFTLLFIPKWSFSDD